MVMNNWRDFSYIIHEMGSGPEPFEKSAPQSGPGRYITMGAEAGNAMRE